MSGDYEEEKMLSLFSNMNLKEEERKVTQEQINAKKRTERNKKCERLKMLHFMGLSNTEIANDLRVNLSLPKSNVFVIRLDIMEILRGLLVQEGKRN